MILKKEQYQSLPEELTNAHPQAEVFWQIPHCQDLQDDKFLTNAQGVWTPLELTEPLLSSFQANFSFFLLAESPPRDLQITAYKYNGLLMRNVIHLCLALVFDCK